MLLNFISIDRKRNISYFYIKFIFVQYINMASKIKCRVAKSDAKFERF